MRENGYYWIKIYKNSDWCVGYYCSEEIDGEIKQVFKLNNGFIHPTYTFYEEKDIFEIGEGKIEIGMD